MVIIGRKWRGSYTVEATAVISLFCLIIAFVILFGFYEHDQAVMKSIANNLAFKGALYKGRYVLPFDDEVDYAALKQKTDVNLRSIESEGYIMLEQRLLFGKVQSVCLEHNGLGDHITAKINVEFCLWKVPILHTVHSECSVFKSSDFPRNNIIETGEEE